MTHLDRRHLMVGGLALTGLAACGKKPFGVSPSCFLTARALEQIKNDVCYSDVPATLIGISSGVSYGALGSTHHSLHDFAVLRAINNLTLIAPADNFESREAIRFAAKSLKPVFVRFGKAAMFNLHAPETKFVPGKAITLRDGKDIAFLATGETVVHSLLAAAHLAERGLNCRVLSLHSIKPLDTDAILRARARIRSGSMRQRRWNRFAPQETAWSRCVSSMFPRATPRQPGRSVTN